MQRSLHRHSDVRKSFFLLAKPHRCPEKPPKLPQAEPSSLLRRKEIFVASQATQMSTKALTDYPLEGAYFAAFPEMPEDKESCLGLKKMVVKAKRLLLKSALQIGLGARLAIIKRSAGRKS